MKLKTRRSAPSRAKAKSDRRVSSKRKPSFADASKRVAGMIEGAPDLSNREGFGIGLKASEVIAEIKALPPEDFAEVSAFMLKVEREDPALRVALRRRQDSLSGHGSSRPYQEAIASVRAALAKAHANRPAAGS